MSPRRALQMPAILSEVGSISLSAEAALLATPAGQRAAAGGVFDGIRAYLAQRPLAVRLEASIPGGSAGQAPTASPGDGPPFWPAVLPSAQGGTYDFTVRLTNTGTAAWPSGTKLVAGWSGSSDPYLAAAPAALTPVASVVPALAPGESVELLVALAASQGDGRQVTWLTLQNPDGTYLTDLGIPPLEVATSGP